MPYIYKRVCIQCYCYSNVKECDNIHKKTVVKRSSKDHIFKMVIVMTVIYFSALLTQFLNYKPKKVH